MLEYYKGNKLLSPPYCGHIEALNTEVHISIAECVSNRTKPTWSPQTKMSSPWSPNTRFWRMRPT
jgi:hypothetical protein